MQQDDEMDIMLDGYDPDREMRRRQRRMRDNDTVREKQTITILNRDSATEAQADTRRKDTEQRAGEGSAKPRQPREPLNFTDNAVVRFFKNRGTRVFIGGALLLISVFVLIAFASFYKNGAIDQSEVINSPVGILGSEAAPVENVAGGWGAWLSQVLFADTLGLGVLVVFVYLWLIAFSLFGIKKCRFWSLTFKTLLVAITVSTVAGLVTYTAATEICWGGVHGRYLNKFLIEHATVLGALIVSALLVLAVVCVYLNELIVAWRKGRSAVARIRARQELATRRSRTLDTVSGEPEAAATPDSDEAATPAPEQQPAAAGQSAHIDLTAATLDESFMIDEPDDQAMSPARKAEKTDRPETSDFIVAAPEIEAAASTETRLPEVEKGLFDHRAELSYYRMPSTDLLVESTDQREINREELEENKDRIIRTLREYKIEIVRIEATVGPTVTLYEIVPAEGIRIAQIKRLEEDIAMKLAATGIRIIAPIPGKGTIGIEVPNGKPRMVSMHSVITSRQFQECDAELPMAIGLTISNDVFIVDLAKIPHMLVAGTTGTGKSVGLNAIIASLLYKKHPSELKFVMIDPKMVEFSHYKRLERHYIAMLSTEYENETDPQPIITDMSKAVATLNSLVVEMENRYKLLQSAGVVKITDYNAMFSRRELNPNDGHFFMPYIVVVIDEFADLIMQVKEVEQPIQRLVQKARAVGIHLIIATQRPSAQVLTGGIKTNCPGRMAFKVAGRMDSMIILDQPGAHRLIGRGDMLFKENDKMERMQCPFISTPEVKAITESINDQAGFAEPYLLPEVPMAEGDAPIAGPSGERDPKFDEVARFVVGRQVGSTSSIQRQFNLGYNRAGRLMDQLEAAGIVGPVNGSKPRTILVDIMTIEQMLGQG